MGFCPQCGVPAPEGARYCASCGASLTGLPAPPGPMPPAPPPPKPDTGLAQTLLLAGAVVSAVLGVLFAGMFAFFARFIAAMGGTPPGFPEAMFGAIAAAVLVLGLVWAGVALYARAELREGRTQRGAAIALVAGLLMLLTGGFIPGLLVLGAGVLAHGAK